MIIQFSLTHPRSNLQMQYQKLSRELEHIRKVYHDGVQSILEARKFCSGSKKLEHDNLMGRVVERGELKKCKFFFKRSVAALKFLSKRCSLPIDQALVSDLPDLDHFTYAVKRTTAELKVIFLERFVYDALKTAKLYHNVNDIVSDCKTLINGMSEKELEAFEKRGGLPRFPDTFGQSAVATQKSARNFNLPTKFLSLRDSYGWSMYGQRLALFAAQIQHLELIVIRECYIQWLYKNKAVETHEDSPLYKVCHLPSAIQNDTPFSDAFMTVLNELVFRVKQGGWIPLAPQILHIVESERDEMLNAARPFIETKLEDGKSVKRQSAWKTHFEGIQRMKEDQMQNLQKREEVESAVLSKYESFLGSLAKKAPSKK